MVMKGTEVKRSTKSHNDVSTRGVFITNYLQFLPLSEFKKLFVPFLKSIE